ncbi:MAG TPA: FAD-binding protein, partial [Sphingorhabdus sp.]|nr:FAD-binding protein [Sphingorhabdus sp.]
MPADPHVLTENNVNWINHHENIVAPVLKRLTVKNEVPTQATMAGMRATAARLQGLIGQAVTAGVRIRACGSRWSFSDLPVSAGGWIVETSRLDWTFAVAAGDVEAGSATKAEDLYLAQCGAKVSKINARLETKERKRALRTTGASNGQTIGGMIGTGVHGSAIGVGGLESQVAGIQLLTATGNIWLEPLRAPVMTAAFATKLGATLVRDNAKFDAALVSLGSMGIVHAVLIRTAKRYRLNSALRHIPFAQLQTALNNLTFAGSGIPNEARTPYFFQVILDPRKMDIGFTTIRYEEDCPDTYVPDYALKSDSEPGTDLPRIIASAIRMFPDLRDVAVRSLMDIELKVRTDTPAQWRTPGETYSFTSAREGVASSGFGVHAAQVTTALEVMRQAFLVHNSAPVVFTCRYAKKSPAMLGFTKFEPTCVIDIDGIET